MFISYQGQSNQDAKIVVTEATGKIRALWVPVTNLQITRPTEPPLTEAEREYRDWQYMERGP